MKKIIVIMMTLTMLVACNSKETIEVSDDLKTLKCDYFNEGFFYDAIYRVKEEDLLSIILTVYTESESDAKDVEETLEALYMTDFDLSEVKDFKLLTSNLNLDEMKNETLEALMIKDVYQKDDMSLETIVSEIEKVAKDKKLDVTCKLI